ncbi:zinc ABC transporter substrate-binding protein [Jannaschia donghaensis]|uniref:High-affinity zinc uptake system protein ZnuA n=1 Tax=Jannaschia donghaensis TaxID=420998 RepID=A0A0M6YHS8_9RHOB|nr:zinc ABC transporter substrate-binding protein [Jannaschia donghaensis]CTQ49510.1 High-affinity zinc uptake system protein ZnuA precursor [Jannaschia donghaensis]
MIPRLAPLLACLTFPAVADVPAVVADIGPVHSMVARVMDGVGNPRLLIPAGVSPHGHAMRPSEADALARADIVFWVGTALAPWLDRAVDSLASDAMSVELLETAAGAPEGAEEDHDDDVDNDAHDDHDGHDHGDIDPHAWLDPVTGKLWLDRIADVLAEADPENAIIYAANAEAGKAELDTLVVEVRAQLEPVRGRGYITFHDAYHGFETRFDMPSLGAISVSDAVPPSAGQVARLRDVVTTAKAVCVFSEPQFDPGLVETLTEGTEARAGVLDPLGATLQPGMTLYPTLLRSIATALEDCLSR